MAVVEENAKHPIRISMVIDDIAACLDSTLTHARIHLPRVERLTTFISTKKTAYVYIYICVCVHSIYIILHKHIKR